MSLFKKYQTTSEEQASKIVKDGVSKMEGLEAEFVNKFPYATYSAAVQEFATSAATPTATHPAVAASVSTTLDALTSMSSDLQTLEGFLHLHIPQMADGGNFGVTIQLALLKQISELQEAIGKHIESLVTYEKDRADALDKLALPSSSSSKTQSTSKTTTDGKLEDKSSETTEVKTTTTDATVATQARVGAVTAVDGLYYIKAKRAMHSTMAMYLAVLDFFDKNEKKLKEPRGSASTSGGYSGMY